MIFMPCEILLILPRAPLPVSMRSLSISLSAESRFDYLVLFQIYSLKLLCDFESFRESSNKQMLVYLWNPSRLQPGSLESSLSSSRRMTSIKLAF